MAQSNGRGGARSADSRSIWRVEPTGTAYRPFIAALFIMAKVWKRPEHSTAGDWQLLCMTEYDTGLQKDDEALWLLLQDDFQAIHYEMKKAKCRALFMRGKIKQSETEHTDTFTVPGYSVLIFFSLCSFCFFSFHIYVLLVGGKK